MKQKIKTICVAAHDAGGAQILAALIKKYAKTFRWIVCVQGPAADIFQREGIDRIARVMAGQKFSVEKILVSVAPDLVLTGTGWSSDVEMNFIQSAKSLEIRTASFLDHWCNYRERFGYPGEWKNRLPDHVFVGDVWAYKRAVADGFPKSCLRQVENPYWEHLRRNVKIKLLYLSSPIAEHALKVFGNERYWGFTEYDQVKDFLELTRIHPELELKIRLHPSEKKNKYARFQDSKFIINPVGQDVMADCQDADIVIGCDTAALVAALIAGRPAISYVPSKTLKSTLPQSGISLVSSKEALKKKVQTFIHPAGADFFVTPLPKVLSGLK